MRAEEKAAVVHETRDMKPQKSHPLYVMAVKMVAQILADHSDLRCGDNL